MPFPGGGTYPEPSGITLANLKADLLTLAGQRLTDDQATALLNEGYAELCVRSEWTRANFPHELLAGENAYPLHGAVNRILKVKVNGKPLMPADEETVDRIGAGDLRLGTGVWGLYWLSFDDVGVESISIYPTPTATEAGLELVANCVVYPVPMSSPTSEPAVPADFTRGIRDYALAKYYGMREDNIELRAFHDQEFENAVERLRRLRISRLGRGNVRMRVEGWTA